MKIKYQHLGNLLDVLHDDAQCPMCKNYEWAVSDEVFEITGERGTKIPLVTIQCPRCGYTAFMNGTVTDITRRKKASLRWI